MTAASTSALLFTPFAEFAFMRRALVACLALALGSAPIGTFLVLRRMSLTGDAMAHALLPGAAIGFIAFGFVLPAMSIGAFAAGLAMALAAGFVTRATAEREDASFAAFYLIALAIGALLVSTHGSSVDLMHLLFSSVLAVDDAALLLVAAVASLTLAALALLYRPLVIECVDPGFLRGVGGRGAAVYVAFLVLTVANLVAGFQALGTLMAVGVMMLPATAARFWVADVWALGGVAAAIALLSGYVGLLLSFHVQWPSGPAIVLVAAGLICCRRSSVAVRAFWRGTCSCGATGPPDAQARAGRRRGTGVGGPAPARAAAFAGGRELFDPRRHRAHAGRRRGECRGADRPGFRSARFSNRRRCTLAVLPRPTW